MFRNIFKTQQINDCFKNTPEIIRRFMAVDMEQHRAEIMAKNLPKKKPINGVKHTILISSGKGGVGKSTTSVNLACALKILNPDKGVGLLDTDVFGPSIPLMMNLNERPRIDDNNRMIPLLNYGVQCMSMGFLIENNSPVIWRGLMVMQAIDKLLRQVVWEAVEYLIVDTPPGTGDTLLSLIQNIPIDGVILVTTPQSTAVQVTKRGAMMFKKLSIPIVGIVENMSIVNCTNCSSSIRIFGDNTQQLARDIDSRILQSFALDNEISNCTDSGRPIVVNNHDSLESQQYRNLAVEIVEYLQKLRGFL